MSARGIEFRPYVPAARPPRGESLAMSPEQMARILWLIEQVGCSENLDKTLEAVYEHIRPLLACNRIGLALLGDDGRVISRWVKSDRPMLLREGYAGTLRGSTLQTILQRREVRIIDDLQQYLSEHPTSDSTSLLVREGMRSSLTCPLLVRDQPVGFLFFTSERVKAYSDAALPFYQHIASQLALVIERARLYSELAAHTATIQQHNERMNHELELARRVQQTLVPASPPLVAGFELSLWYQPVMQVGGDLVDFSPLPDGSLMITVADAMGHGVQAALMMSVLKGMLSSLTRTPVPVGDLMQQLNGALFPLMQEYFAVAMCIHIEPGMNLLRLARAGIPPAILWRGQTRDVLELEQGGLPLAIGNEPYPVQEVSFFPGDMLLVATDGLVESLDPQDQQFGSGRLITAIGDCGGQTAQQTLDCVLAARRRFCGDREQSDDMTLLAVRRLAQSGNPGLR